MSCRSLDILIGRLLAVSLDENGCKHPVAGLKHDAKIVVIKCYRAYLKGALEHYTIASAGKA